ncbi:hexokinase type 2-like [Littorina saxatilis]|uniref:hexokinase type 2-like n=1 Tax=Littorina saxatilis TaxID=31220 RepID=UPI0038B54BB5
MGDVNCAVRTMGDVNCAVRNMGDVNCAVRTMGDVNCDCGRTMSAVNCDLEDYGMEKMVSIRYLGKIISLILEELTKKGLLFRSRSKQFNSKRGDFTRDMVSLVESEKKKDFSLTQVVLKRIQENKNTTIEDCRIVQYVTRIVLERAAHLAAAGLATLINRIGQPEETVVVAIGGLSLDIYHPYFKQVLEAKTWKLVKPGLKFKIVSSCVGREMGAAFIAAAFEHQVVTKHKKNANSKRKKKE